MRLDSLHCSNKKGTATSVLVCRWRPRSSWRWRTRCGKWCALGDLVSRTGKSVWCSYFWGWIAHGRGWGWIAHSEFSVFLLCNTQNSMFVGAGSNWAGASQTNTTEPLYWDWLKLDCKKEKQSMCFHFILFCFNWGDHKRSLPMRSPCGTEHGAESMGYGTTGKSLESVARHLWFRVSIISLAKLGWKASMVIRLESLKPIAN